MLELGAIRITADEVLGMGRNGSCLLLQIRVAWRELPLFVLLPDELTLRWDHLDDDGLPVRLASWRSRPCDGDPGTARLNLRLCLLPDQPPSEPPASSPTLSGSGRSSAWV